MLLNLQKVILLTLVLGFIPLAQGQLPASQESLWQFSHSIPIPAVDTPWMAPDCHIYPHSASTVAYHVPGCGATNPVQINWTYGSIGQFWTDDGFTSQEFGTEDFGDLSLIVPSFPSFPSCNSHPRYSQYADTDNDGVNERIVWVYGCFNDQPIVSFLLDHNGTDWQYTEYPGSLMFAADTNNDGSLELVDLVNDFSGGFIGDGYFKYLDLDNNGYRDFIFFYDHSVEHGIWMNNGDGTFYKLAGSLIRGSGRHTNFTDFNNDGKLDLVLFNGYYDQPGNLIEVYENVGAVQGGTWVDTGANWQDEVLLNGAALPFHPEHVSYRALRVGNPVHVAGSNPTVQVVSKTTPSLQDGSAGGSTGSSGGSTGGGSTGGGSTGGGTDGGTGGGTYESPPVSTSAYGDAPASGTLEVIPNTVNSNYGPSSSEVVTMGIPFSSCKLTGSNRTDQFRLLDENGQEVPVFVKETLSWPAQLSCGSESTRALKVQFEFDATGGYKTYSWDLAGRSTAAEFESPVAEVLTSDPRKGSLYEPRVFVVHEPGYLVATGLIPPTTVATTDVYDAHYYPEKWEFDSRDFDYTSSTVANWLFDRVSTNYRQAIRRGDVAHYREAYLSHEFYIERIDDTNVPDDNGQPQSGGTQCIGGWAMGGIQRYCDSKFSYSEAIKLHLALTGDDSWQPDPNPYANTREAMWKQMSDVMVRGDTRPWPNGTVPAQGFIDPYSDLDATYTERFSGIGLTTVLNSCQLTLDGEVCSWVDQIVDNIYTHQVNNPDGLGNDGSLRHSWAEHEFAPLQWVGKLASNGGTTIEVSDAIGSTNLVAGDLIRIGRNSWSGSDYTLGSAPVELGGGRWRLTLTSGVSETPGDSVNVFTDRAGMDGDRAFSVWMSAYVADALWQYYHWTTDSERKEKAAAILLGLGHAVTKYGIWGGDINPSTEALIESAFSTPQETIEFYRDPDLVMYGGGGYCGLTVAPFPYYASSNRVNVAGSDANVPWIRQYLNGAGDYSNQHLPDVLFMMSTAIYFESDPARRSAMEALAADMLDWFDKYECTAGNKNRHPSSISDPPRAFNWQNKTDPYGTYKWVIGYLNDGPGGNGSGNGTPPWENENLVSNPDLPWPAPFNGVLPEMSLNIVYNNIGLYSELDQYLYTCIRIMLNNQPFPLYNGAHEFDVVFEVIPDSYDILRIVNIREFNKGLATNINNDLPDCSGIFELNSSMYTDVVQVGENTYGIVATVASSDNFELRLVSTSEFL